MSKNLVSSSDIKPTVNGNDIMLNFVNEMYSKAQTDTLLSNKVNVESGKGLSTNDYTTAEKNKLANINTIEDAVTNYYALTPDYKTYTVRFPLWATSNTSASNNTIGFIRQQTCHIPGTIQLTVIRIFFEWIVHKCLSILFRSI